MQQTFRDRVKIEVADAIAQVRLARPDKRNALDGAMFAGLAEAGEWVKTAPRVRAVVLSGEGPSFCAGLDFATFQAFADRSGGDRAGAGASEVPETDGNPGRLTASGLTHLGQQVAWVWQEVPVPVIAAVHGHALGGGLQVALGADMRIVHPDTKLSVREVHWGLTPDMTATLFLSRLVRPDVLKELTFTARLISGAEAHRLGIATHLADDPPAAATALAAEIAGRSPDAVRGAKALLNRLANAGAAEQFAGERDTIGALVGSANQVEAVMAEFEQREPRFVDPG